MSRQLHRHRLAQLLDDLADIRIALAPKLARAGVDRDVPANPQAWKSVL